MIIFDGVHLAALMETTEPQTCYQEACVAGRDWALQELQRAGGNRNTVADIQEQLYEVTVAYVALQTGRLPSLFSDPDRHDIELSEGFHTGANNIISGYRRSRAALR